MNLFHRVYLVILALSLAACLGQESPPSEAPANFEVAEGSGVVVVNWDYEPGRTYWIFYKQGTDVSLNTYDRILVNVTPPYIVAGLSNATEYAFSVTSFKDASKAGPFSPVLTATPRLLSSSVAWTIGTPLGANDLHGIAFGNNMYVTVGDAATVYAAPFNYPSVGGVTGWNPATTLPGGLAADLRSVVFDGLGFVALGDDGSIIKSTDTEALNWVDATAITDVPAVSMNALTVGVGLYVAVGNSGAIYTSSDGAATAWTTQASGTSNDLYGVSYLNGNFIAVGASGTLLTSLDGITWEIRSSGTGSNLLGVAYGAGNYVAVGDTGAIVSSPDATTWAAQSTPTSESFRAISFGPDAQFVAVGTAGMLAYSETGADGTWDATSTAGTDDLNALYPNLLYIATGAAGAIVSGK